MKLGRLAVFPFTCARQDPCSRCQHVVRYLRGPCLDRARDGWSCPLLSPARRQVADTFQGALLLFYPQNTWMVCKYLNTFLLQGG